MKKISVVVACYNSESSLREVVYCLTGIDCSRIGYEIEVVLVNDCSNDGTLGVIRDLCREFEDVRGVSLARNFGQQSAMLAGFRYCEGDYIAYCDDDGQSPVTDLIQLVQHLEEGYDMVWAKYPERKGSVFKRVGSVVNDKMVNLLIGKPRDLYFGNLWVARKFVIIEAMKCTNPFPYLGGLFLSITKNMSNVELAQNDSKRGESRYSFWRLLSVWLNGFTAYSVVPLRLASLTGVASSCGGFIFMVYILVQRFVSENAVDGYSSIMSVLLFMFGVVLITLGLMGEYLGRLYINVNRVPQFVIKEVIE
jgi:undecaprenyl-phosphate 4-deoxy-4-formamido-L-arabinose transferase